MAEQGFNYGDRGGGGGGFLGLDQKYVAAIIIAVLLAVAILGAAYLMRPTPAPTPAPAPVDTSAQAACIAVGGTWLGVVNGIPGRCLT